MESTRGGEEHENNEEQEEEQGGGRRDNPTHEHKDGARNYMAICAVQQKIDHHQRVRQLEL